MNETLYASKNLTRAPVPGAEQLLFEYTNDTSLHFSTSNSSSGIAANRAATCGLCEPILDILDAALCAQDCFGTYAGDAVQDFCGICSGGDSGTPVNASLNCRGECFGDEFEPNSTECLCFELGLEYQASSEPGEFYDDQVAALGCPKLENDFIDISGAFSFFLPHIHLFDMTSFCAY